MTSVHLRFLQSRSWWPWLHQRLPRMAPPPPAPPTRSPLAARPLRRPGPPDCQIGLRDWRRTAPAPAGLSGSPSSRSPAPVRWSTTRPATPDSRGTTWGSWPTAAELWTNATLRHPTEHPSILSTTRRSPTELCLVTRQRKSHRQRPIPK